MDGLGSAPSLYSWGLNLLPIVLLVAIWLFIMRQMRKHNRGGRWMSWENEQRRQTEVLEKQLELLRENNELLKKLAGKQ